MLVHKTNLKVKKVGDKIDTEVFMAKQVDIAVTRQGKEYYNILFLNEHGAAWIKIWDIIDKVNPGDYVELTAKAKDEGKYGVQWNLSRYKISNYGGDPKFATHVKSQVVDPTKLFGQIFNYKYLNPTVVKIRDAMVADYDFVDKFSFAPASMKNHHSFSSGLLLHTHEVWDTSRKLCNIYPAVNKDIVLFGAAIHDISNVDEYKFSDNKVTITAHPNNRMVYNTAYGLLHLEHFICTLDKSTLDPEVIMQLRHIIVSHHGKREWGSPVAPATREAFVVAAADNLSARLQQFENAIEEDTSDDEHFTKRVYFLDGSTIYKKPIAVQGVVTDGETEEVEEVA